MASDQQTMKCAEFLDLISEYLDGELAPAQAEAARLHSLACAGCAAELASVRRLLAWMAEEREQEMPPGARARLRQRLDRDLPAKARGPVPGPSWWRWRPAWAAVAVAVLLGAGLLQWRAGATTVSGWLMDDNCAVQFHGARASHTRGCLLRCERFGYGVVSPQGTFLRFDASGNRSALAALRHAKRRDHVWVVVRGRPGQHQMIQVQHLALGRAPAS